jgi:hypothetical protein
MSTGLRAHDLQRVAGYFAGFFKSAHMLQSIPMPKMRPFMPPGTVAPELLAAARAPMKTIRCETTEDFEKAHEAALKLPGPTQVRIEEWRDGRRVAIVEVHKPLIKS